MTRLRIKDSDGRLQEQGIGRMGRGEEGELEIGPKARHNMPRSRLHPAPLQRALKSL